MNCETKGTVISASKQWWMKVNTKPVRMISTDKATFPYIIKVRYSVDGKDYTKRKWISAGCSVPEVGSSVTVSYDSTKPNRAKVIC